MRAYYIFQMLMQLRQNIIADLQKGKIVRYLIKNTVSRISLNNTAWSILARWLVSWAIYTSKIKETITIFFATFPFRNRTKSAYKNNSTATCTEESSWTTHMICNQASWVTIRSNNSTYEQYFLNSFLLDKSKRLLCLLWVANKINMLTNIFNLRVLW